MAKNIKERMERMKNRSVSICTGGGGAGWAGSTIEPVRLYHEKHQCSC